MSISQTGLMKTQKNNIKKVLAYGNIKNEIKQTNKSYSTIFNKEKDKVIFFECYLEHPIGFEGYVEISYEIYFENVAFLSQKMSVKCMPGHQIFTIGMVVVNRAGEHIVNGDYTARLKVGKLEGYYFDFMIIGNTPMRYCLLKTLRKLVGL